MTNITCICADEWFKETVQSCVEKSCNVTDELVVVRADAELCHIPKRSRRAEQLSLTGFEVFCFFAILLRLYSRWKLCEKYGVDDWIMVAVAVIDAAFVAIGNYASMLGFGVDTWYISQDDLTFALKLFYIDESLYLVLLGLTKVSILFFYLRIFPNRRFRMLCWVVMCWVLVATTTFVSLQIFQCTPLSAIWESWKGSYPVPYHCFHVNALAYAAAGFSIAQDIVILALPLPLLLRLNTNWRRKVVILIMFSLGISVLATSCIRLRVMVQFAKSANPSWDYAETLIWSGAEVTMSILVASLPAIRTLMVRVWPKILLTGARNCNARPSENSSEPKKPPLGIGKGPARPRQSRLFSMLARTRGEDGPNDSRLELGDCIRGNIRTGTSIGNTLAEVDGVPPRRLTLGSTIGTDFLDDEGSLGFSRGSINPT